MPSLVLLTLAWLGSAHADPYADAWERADLEALLPWRTLYPQDYALALQVGWLAFQAERYPEAEQAYADAVTLSGGARDAVLGLAWTRLRLGDAASASDLLTDLDPDDPDVLELSALLRAPEPPSTGTWVGAGTALTALPAGREPSTAVEVRIAARALGRRVSGGVDAVVTSYGGILATVEPGMMAARGPGPGNQGGDGIPAAGPWAPQPTLGLDLGFWGHVGGGGERFGFEGTGAALLQTATDVAAGWVAGGIARWSPTGHGRLEASWTQPRGGVAGVARVAPSWWLDVSTFALQPEVALQLAGDTPLPSAGGTLWWIPGDLAVWAGGRGGPQRYATSLALRTTATWPDLDRAGAWAGVRVGSLEHAWATAGWSAAWLDPDDGDPEPARPAHTVTATLNLTL